MEKQVTYIFDDEDIELLKDGNLPTKPCLPCRSMDLGDCFKSLSELSKYEERIKPYKDRGILEFKHQFDRLDEIYRTIKNLSGEWLDIYQKLEDAFGKDLTREIIEDGGKHDEWFLQRQFGHEDQGEEECRSEDQEGC